MQQSNTNVYINSWAFILKKDWREMTETHITGVCMCWLVLKLCPTEGKTNQQTLFQIEPLADFIPIAKFVDFILFSFLIDKTHHSKAITIINPDINQWFHRVNRIITLTIHLKTNKHNCWADSDRFSHCNGNNQNFKSKTSCFRCFN